MPAFKLPLLCPALLCSAFLAGCDKRPTPRETGDATSAPATAAAPVQPAASAADTSPESKAIQRRAAEATTWGVPAVNFEMLFAAFKNAGGDWNQVAYWSRLPDWKNQTLTPNPDVIYLIPFYDTRSGPVVLEIPAADGSSSITGSIDDGWQAAVEDVGPAGVDKGKGGRYLILPPGYQGDIPAGYIPLHSPTYAGYALLRSNIGKGSAAEIEAAAAYGRRVKIYPYAQAGSPPETRFVDVVDQVYDATLPYDARFFERLNDFVQREPWLPRDRAWIDPLKTLGIAKGKPYAPAPRQAVESGVAEARAWLESRYENSFEPYFPGKRWAVPVSQEFIDALSNNFDGADSYPTDARGLAYTFGFFSAKHLGQGQFYLMTTRDAQGQPLDGGASYVLTVPRDAPVKLYWSATAYDRTTHALIRDQKWSSRASTTQGLATNPDGSVDVYFGPQAPAGKESNWVPTKAGAPFEVLFRLYGPTQPLFDKTWVLPDIQRVAPATQHQ